MTGTFFDSGDYDICVVEWELDRIFAKLLWMGAFVSPRVLCEDPEKSVIRIDRLSVAKENAHTK